MNERIKKIRKDAGLTMEEFGEKIGMKRSSISLVESGRNKPSDAAVKMICTVFNVDEHWLRTGEGEPYIELSEHEQIIQRLNQVQWAMRDPNSEAEQKELAAFRERLASAILNLDDDGCRTMIQLLHQINGTEKEEG